MQHLAQLVSTIQNAINSQRIGQPVFVRVLMSGEAAAPARIAHLSGVVAAVRHWVGQPIDRIYALPSSEADLVAIHVEFQGGPTALVSTVTAGPAGPALDVMVLGNHGAIYHEAPCAGGGPEQDAPGSDGAAALRSVIERAIRSGMPEPVPPEETP